MQVFEGNESDFSNTIKERVWLVKFYADWCGPCAQTKTPFDAYIAGSHYEGLEVDVEANGNIAVAYDIMSLPTVLVMSDGEEVGRLIGTFTEESLSEQVEAFLNSEE